MKQSWDGGIALETPKFQWHYSDSEWDRHVEWQRHQALRGAIRSSFVSLIACAGVVLVSHSWVALAVLVLLTAWIPVMEVFSANSSGKSLLGKPAGSMVSLAQVSYTHFVLGERVVRLDNRRILGAELYRAGRSARGEAAREADDSAAPIYLKIVHKGKMRRSNTLPELILIPEGREQEAQAMVQALTERKLKDAKDAAAERKPWQFWKRGREQ
jgi:hypothetical protein